MPKQKRGGSKISRSIKGGNQKQSTIATNQNQPPSSPTDSYNAHRKHSINNNNNINNNNRKQDPRVGNLKRYIDCNSTQNKKIQADMDDALYQSKVDIAQVRVMKKKTKKTVYNTNKTVQYVQSAVHNSGYRNGKMQ